MIAKYNGFCKVTNQKIIAGQTVIEKINGQWQAVNISKNEIVKGSIVRPKHNGLDELGRQINHRITTGKVVSIWNEKFNGKDTQMCAIKWLERDYWGYNQTDRILVRNLELVK